MSRFPALPAYFRAGLLIFVGCLAIFTANARAAGTISSHDVNGKPVTVNGSGHYTVVIYTNPDLEDTSRKVTLALDPYRSRSDFTFVRVVDLRGGVPPQMRSIVSGQIRKEIAKENARLKKAGVESSESRAPIIPDFSGSLLSALGWGSLYDTVKVVVYDRSGKEIKRLENVSTGSQVAKVVDNIL